MDTQRLKHVLLSGGVFVSYRTFITTLALLSVTIIGGGWGVFVYADPASKSEVAAAESRVTTAVKESEERLKDDIAEQRIEQREMDGKIDQVLYLLINNANASEGENQ